MATRAKFEGRERLREQIDQRTTEVGEDVRSAAQAVRRTVQQLRTEGNGRAADLLEGIADRGERLGGYLREADGDRMLRDVEGFARRQPWLFTGAGALIGFMTARFVKASSGSRYSTSHDARFTGPESRSRSQQLPPRSGSTQVLRDEQYGSRSEQSVSTGGGSSGVG
jgi:hypothetical protein